jgi:hypothetical protein
MGGFQRFCAQCGHELEQGTPVCATCGHAVAVNSPYTAPAGEDEAATRELSIMAPHPSPAWDSPAYPPGGSASPPPSATDTAEFPANWMDNIGFSPQWEQNSPPPDDGDAGRHPASQHLSRRLPVLGLIALLAAVIVVPALLILRSFQSSTGAHNASQPTAKRSSHGSTASSPQQRQAAEGLAALLAQSVTDRNSISNAVSDVNHCGPSLRQDPQIFRSAASSRRHLLTDLANLPGHSVLPQQLLQALTGAWQASVTVDQDLARWAQDEASQGCALNNHADPNLLAANGPDSQATADKTAFASIWNSIAVTYGLTTYQTGQL